MKKATGILFALLLLAGCSSKTVNSHNISTTPVVPIMPGITPDMNNAGFWVSQMDFPDAVIMTLEEIQEFNLKIAKEQDILTISEYDDNKSGEFISKSMLTLFNYIASRELYTPEGKKVTKKQMEELRQQFQLEKLENIIHPVAFGIIIENVPHRVLPTDDIMGKATDKGMFDRLQMSSLPIGTPAAVLWKSADREWIYVRTPLTIGWVKTTSIAYCSKEDIKKWEQMETFTVVVRHKAPIYQDPAMLSYTAWAAMGTKLPMDNGTVMLPQRNDSGRLSLKKVYIESEFINAGYVPYTSRNMLKLAFEMLNAPYGWGGMFGEQDCSGFLVQIFGAAGITLPRNTSQQGQTGKLIYSKFYEVSLPARQNLVFFGIPGAAVVQLPGHIMLYVGNISGEPYVIHALWAFEELEHGSPALRLPARVALSDLNLSTHSKKGPYIDRASNIRNITGE